MTNNQTNNTNNFTKKRRKYFKHNKKPKKEFDKNEKIKEINSKTHQQINDFITKKYPKLKGTKRISLEHNINFTGWYIYDRIYEFLKRNGYKKINQLLIQSILIYDKRLKNILFKYVGIIEEYYRAKLYNISKKDKCDLIEKSPFNDLINKLESEIIFRDITPSLRAIKELRNEVCHHNLLLIEQDYSLSTKNIETIKKIKDLIRNQEIKEAFIFDVNNASSKKKTKEKYNKIYKKIPKILRINL